MSNEPHDVVSFTRADSDRLVRLEESVKALAEIKELILKQNGRVTKLERKQSWQNGIFTAVVFILSAVIGFFHREL